jgi:hypothetical protein
MAILFLRLYNTIYQIDSMSEAVYQILDIHDPSKGHTHVYMLRCIDIFLCV